MKNYHLHQFRGSAIIKSYLNIILTQENMNFFYIYFVINIEIYFTFFVAKILRCFHYSNFVFLLFQGSCLYLCFKKTNCLAMTATPVNESELSTVRYHCDLAMTVPVSVSLLLHRTDAITMYRNGKEYSSQSDIKAMEEQVSKTVHDNLCILKQCVLLDFIILIQFAIT